MPEVTGGEAVVAALAREGVTAVFGIPGTYNLPVYDALYGTPSIQHVLARHEGGAALMADGYARASGRPGVCLTIAGPGATNALTGLVTAYAESAPVLMITTEIEQALIGHDRGVSHEIKGQLKIFQAALADARRADRVAEIAPCIHTLMATMRRGRPRPTYLEVPWDVLGARGVVEPSDLPAVEAPPGDDAAVQAARERLANARRPLIFSGLGTIRAGAGRELCALAERLSAPVITTANGKGGLPEDHPLALGAGVGRNPALTATLAEADVVLAVGTSFDIWSMLNWQIPIPGVLIRVDIAAEQLDKNYPADIAIHADARLGLARLTEGLTSRPEARVWAAASAAAARDARALSTAGDPPGARVARQLRASLPRDAIVVVDTTMVLQWIAWNFPVYEPGALLLPWNAGTLGFALPAALGAQVAHPDRAVVALVGDGGFLFTGQELATGVQHALPVITILFNNQAHGAIKKQQLESFSGRLLGVDLPGPDFAAFAQALGADGRRLVDADALGDALSEALAARAPTLLEVPVGLADLAHPWAA